MLSYHNWKLLIPVSTVCSSTDYLPCQCFSKKSQSLFHPLVLGIHLPTVTIRAQCTLGMLEVDLVMLYRAVEWRLTYASFVEQDWDFKWGVHFQLFVLRTFFFFLYSWAVDLVMCKHLTTDSTKVKSRTGGCFHREYSEPFLCFQTK